MIKSQEGRQIAYFSWKAGVYTRQASEKYDPQAGESTTDKG
jgi:hypothetical protein